MLITTNERFHLQSGTMKFLETALLRASEREEQRSRLLRLVRKREHSSQEYPIVKNEMPARAAETSDGKSFKGGVSPVRSESGGVAAASSRPVGIEMLKPVVGMGYENVESSAYLGSLVEQKPSSYANTIVQQEQSELQQLQAESVMYRSSRIFQQSMKMQKQSIRLHRHADALVSRIRMDSLFDLTEMPKSVSIYENAIGSRRFSSGLARIDSTQANKQDEGIQRIQAERRSGLQDEHSPGVRDEQSPGERDEQNPDKQDELGSGKRADHSLQTQNFAGSIGQMEQTGLQQLQAETIMYRSSRTIQPFMKAEKKNISRRYYAAALASEIRMESLFDLSVVPKSVIIYEIAAESHRLNSQAARRTDRAFELESTGFQQLQAESIKYRSSRTHQQSMNATTRTQSFYRHAVALAAEIKLEKLFDLSAGQKNVLIYGDGKRITHLGSQDERSHSGQPDFAVAHNSKPQNDGTLMVQADANMIHQTSAGSEQLKLETVLYRSSRLQHRYLHKATGNASLRRIAIAAQPEIKMDELFDFTEQQKSVIVIPNARGNKPVGSQAPWIHSTQPGLADAVAYIGQSGVASSYAIEAQPINQPERNERSRLHSEAIQYRSMRLQRLKSNELKVSLIASDIPLLWAQAETNIEHRHAMNTPQAINKGNHDSRDSKQTILESMKGTWMGLGTSSGLDRNANNIFNEPDTSQASIHQRVAEPGWVKAGMPSLHMQPQSKEADLRESLVLILREDALRHGINLKG